MKMQWKCNENAMKSSNTRELPSLKNIITYGLFCLFTLSWINKVSAQSQATWPLRTIINTTPNPNDPIATPYQYESTLSQGDAQGILNNLHTYYQKYSNLKTEEWQTFWQILQELNLQFPAFVNQSDKIPSYGKLSNDLNLLLVEHKINLNPNDKKIVEIMIMLENIDKIYNVIVNKQNWLSYRYKLLIHSDTPEAMEAALQFKLLGKIGELLAKLNQIIPEYNNKRETPSTPTKGKNKNNQERSVWEIWKEIIRLYSQIESYMNED